MKTIWITYAWDDNKTDDVDYIAQELSRAGLNVQLDRWTIKAGQHLWPQIEEFIQSPEQCDAWLMIATQNSLGSGPCKEEYLMALERAIKSRGVAFPLIALFPGQVDDKLIPAPIRNRLFVSSRDSDWLERIVAATEGRNPEIKRKELDPYVMTVHDNLVADRIGSRFAIEMRPRAGTWNPVFVGVPTDEASKVDPGVTVGPPGQRPRGRINRGASHWTDSEMSFMSANEEATSTMSMFILCSEIPSKIVFGADGEGQPVHYVGLNVRPKPAS